MSFFGDLGQLGSDLFTGRWTGGETNLAHDNWTPAAELGGAIGATALTAGLAGPALFGGEAAGAGAAGAGVGAAEAGGTALPAFGDLGLTGGASTAWGAGALDPTVAGAYASADTGAALTAPATGGLEGALGGAATPTALPSATGPEAASFLGPDTAGAGGGSSFLSTLTSPSQWTLGGVAQGAGAAIAGGGLLANLMKGNSPPAAQNQMTNAAGAFRQQGQQITAESAQLRSYLENSTLPPGLQAKVDQAAKAAKATRIANAGKNGESTDPTRNTALAQDLAAIDREALIQAGGLETQLFSSGQQLLQSGLNASGLSADLYAKLAALDRSDTANLNQSIAAFSAALAGGGKGLSVNLGQTTHA